VADVLNERAAPLPHVQLRALALHRLPVLAQAFEAEGAGERILELLGPDFELPHLSALVDLLVNA
jgi:hypothetical protein